MKRPFGKQELDDNSAMTGGARLLTDEYQALFQRIERATYNFLGEQQAAEKSLKMFHIAALDQIEHLQHAVTQRHQSNI